VGSGDTVNVSIPSVRLPLRDLFLNDQALKISADAVHGPVDPISIIESPATGPFSREPFVSFDENKASDPTSALTINMILSDGMHLHDRIHLILPGFSSESSSINTTVERIDRRCTQLCALQCNFTAPNISTANVSDGNITQHNLTTYNSSECPANNWGDTGHLESHSKRFDHSDI